jgi:5-formyltetrahydrofolate cyclo-ligase
MFTPPSNKWQGRNYQKDRLRAEIWSLLKKQNICQRNPQGHIPNFKGCEKAAENLAGLSIWQKANVIKCNPDSPCMPIRLRALQDGKCLYMAVPQLKTRRCFVELTAENLQKRSICLEEAAIAQKALSYGRLVSFEEMQPIDLVTVGCVAVTQNGGRMGKGAGFADLELAMLAELNLITAITPIVTAIHPLQIVENSRLLMEAHDWPLNWIVTPFEVIETKTIYPRPQGLNKDMICSEQYESMPILRDWKEAGWVLKPNQNC